MCGSNGATVPRAALLCALLAACGPLVEAGYRGEPLFTVAGQVRSTGEMEWLLGPASVDIPITVGLFWARAGDAAVQQEVGISTTFPARYEMTLRQPPPTDALLDVSWAPDGPVALGLPLLFLDDDGDGVRSDGEPLVGNAAGIHVLFATADGRLSAGTDTVRVRSGFQRVGAQQAGCDLDGAPVGLVRVPADIPTDLVVGPAFVQLIDIDCDGTSDEWAACPTGDYLEEWCERAQDFLFHEHPCLDECT